MHIYAHIHINTHIHPALQCTCNNDAWTSDCRWDEWTCTEPDGVSVCYAKVKMLSDGSIRRDFGCLRTDWNPPDICSGGRNTNTIVYECCKGNLCNEHLSPSLHGVATPTDTSAALPFPTSTVQLSSAITSLAGPSPVTTTSLTGPSPAATTSLASPSTSASPEITATPAPATEPPAGE